MTRSRILVTGGAGFIGSHLCKKLLNLGFEVICLDNFFTGSKNNILDIIDNPYFELLRHDIIQPIRVEVDYIFNLACAASPIHYQRYPVQTTKTSVNGIINMLGLAKRLRIPLIQASTSEIYGDPEVHPQPESYVGHVNPIGPRACYDEGKRCAETLCFDYRYQYGVDTKIMRIFNTYGPYMAVNDGRAISNFIVQALNNSDITVYGDGLQTRSFCYIDDTVNGFIKLMYTDKSLMGPINIGNPNEITLLEIAQKIIDLTSSTSNIVFAPLPQDDPKRRNPDIKVAKEKLNWHPEISLQDGLDKTISYFRKI